MKLKKRFAAMGAAMVMAVSMMGMGASAIHEANTGSRSNAYLSVYGANSGSGWMEIYTKSTNKTNTTRLVTARADVRNSSDAVLISVVDSDIRSKNGYKTVEYSQEAISGLHHSYHYSCIYNSAAYQSGIYKSLYFNNLDF